MPQALPPGDDQIVQDFNASRGPQVDDSWIRQAAAQAGGSRLGAAPQDGTPPAGGAAPAAGAKAPAAPSSLPFGLQVQQYVDRARALPGTLWNAAKGALNNRNLPTPGQAFTGTISDAWNSLKTDVSNSLNLHVPDSAWDAAQELFHRQVAAGKSLVDAFNLATSPLTGAFNAASTEAGRLFQDATGLPGGYVKFPADVAATLAPVAGAAKAGLAAEGVEGAEAAAAAEKEPPAAAGPDDDGGSPPGGAAAAVSAPAASGEAPVIPAEARDQAAAAAATANAPGGTGAASAEERGAAAPGADETAPAEKEEPFSFDGEAASSVRVTPEIQKRVANYLNGDAITNPVDVSIEALAHPVSRDDAILQLSKLIPKEDVKPIELTQMGAYSLNLQPEEVMQAIKNKFAGADEHFAAAYMALDSASSQFWELSRAYQDNPNDENFEKASRAYTIVNDYIGSLRDAKSNWGLAGRIQQESAQTNSPFTKHIRNIIENIGPDNVEQVIRKAAAFEEPKKVSPWVSTLRSMTSRDGMLYGWYNYLLGPGTIVKKLGTDATIAMWEGAVRYAAEKFGGGAPGHVQVGEAAQLMTGYASSIKDGIRAAGKAMREGQSQFYGDYQTIDGLTHTRLQSLMNGVESPLPEGSNIRAAADMLRMALPTTWMGAADDFAKVMNYRGELHALAFREGMQNGLEGDALQDHIQNRLANVPQGMHEQALANALRNTFDSELSPLAQKISDTVDNINLPVPRTGLEIPLGRIIMPFVRRPANFVRWAYQNGPLSAAFPSEYVRNELAAGGARRDLMLARQALGSGVAVATLPLVLTGLMTGGGPSSPQMHGARLDAGIPDYSVKIGPNWYRFDRIEPVGTILGSIADTIETMKYAKQEDADQAASSLVFGIGHALMSKTYMQGMSDFLEALNDPDNAHNWVDNLAAAASVPGVVNMVRNGLDPWLRYHAGLLASIKNRVPGLSSELPPQTDTFGDPIKRPEAFMPFLSGTPMAQMLSPISEEGGKVDPIKAWIWEHRNDFPEGPQGRIGLGKPGQIESFREGQHVSTQVELTPQQLFKLRRMTGNGLKDPQTGLGAKDALNALVTGKYPDAAVQERWNQSSPGAQALMVLSLWNHYRGAAKKALAASDPDLSAALAAGWGARRQQLAGAPSSAAPSTLGP